MDIYHWKVKNMKWTDKPKKSRKWGENSRQVFNTCFRILSNALQGQCNQAVIKIMHDKQKNLLLHHSSQVLKSKWFLPCHLHLKKENETPEQDMWKIQELLPSENWFELTSIFPVPKGFTFQIPSLKFPFSSVCTKMSL